MVFSSMVFLLAFMPVTLLAYFLVPQGKTKGRNLVLLLSSLFFYGWGEPKYILVMVLSILFNFCLAIALEKRKDTGEQHGVKAMLLLAVGGNLAILGVFKYADFLITTINHLTGSGLGSLGIALPIGISFYTFQTMSYVIDVYRGKVRAQRDLMAFSMYVTLFPQLIAGPIVRYSDVEERLQERRTSLEQMEAGLRRFVIGLGKKVLLANQVSVIWKEISAMSNVSVAAAWLGALAFTFQIYFDFSGYSDMAIGLGKLFGFDYLENFNYPYISRSITEFWRRWHISLSSWFKEYVYIPLGGNRKGLSRQIFNIAIVWALTGLWHGASWNFVLWGIYFGIILIIEKLFLLSILERLPAAIGHIYTLLLIVTGWVIFAIDDLGQVGSYLSQMVGSSGMLTDDTFFYYGKTRLWLLLACGIGGTPLPAKVCSRALKTLDGEILLGLLELFVLMGILALSVAFLVSGSYNPFLYFRF